jgi:hypothetical protein
MQWVKGIENLNVSRFRTQGIVGAAVFIHMFTASCRQADYPQIARGGSHRIPNSSFPWMYWPRCSAPNSTKR